MRTLWTWGILAWVALPAVTAAQPRLAFERSDLAPIARDVPARGSLRLTGVPLGADGAAVDVDLVRVNVFAADAVVELRGPQGVERLTVPDTAWFHGRIMGRPSSRVFLSAREDGSLRGFLFDGGRAFAVGDEARAGGARVVRELAVAAPTGEPRRDGCHSPRLTPAALSGPQPARAPTAPHVAHTVRVAVETDWGFLQNVHPSHDPSLALNYVGDLFAYASSLFADEVDTGLLVSHVTLWTQGDPWNIDVQDAQCALMDFGRYWNLNRDSVPRSVAYFLSGRLLGGPSGAAWDGALCGAPFAANANCPMLPPQGTTPGDLWGGAYGLVGNVVGDFDLSSPSQVWAIIGLAHQIGHTFHSPHTNCYAGLGGNASPVDACSNDEASAGCWAGSESLPGLGALTGGSPGASNGTLMSECQRFSGELTNVALTFGANHAYGVAAARVPARMRDYVSATAAAHPGCLDFQRPLKGDFNLDGQADLLLLHPFSNQHQFWWMNGTTRSYEGPLVPTTPLFRRVVGTDDFNGDQRIDVVMQYPALGGVEFWMMKSDGSRWGEPVPLSASLPVEWQVIATADFDVDGHPDLLWRNASTQKLTIWTLNGVTHEGTLTPSPDQAINANWAVVAALDYNGDGTIDLLWYNATSGKAVLWFMDAAVQRLSGQFTDPPNAGDNNWKIVASSDYGVGPGGIAGTADIVWRNASSGKFVVWYMDLAGRRSAGTFTTPDAPASPLAWTVVGPR